MCLFVEQTEGSRVELATAASNAIKAHDLAKAEEIYFSVTGQNFLEHNKKILDVNSRTWAPEGFIRDGKCPNSWLIYNMPAQIRQHVEDKYWPKFEAKHNDDQRFYEVLRANAERAYGGKWIVRYEY